ncbi:MAG TPA: ABC transporter permease [Candidatus Acidoferrum sp.]|nr:ABC transporter permease [Candidatus Acidoferrum sp.]
MFLRLVADSFTRRPKRKLLTLAALALGMAVATAALSVSLDVGDRLAQEFRSLGANLLVTPEADSLPLEIGGVDYRPANAGAYLPEADLGKLKTIFWRFNIVAFAPILEVPVQAWSPASKNWSSPGVVDTTTLIGTWSDHTVPIPDGTTYQTGVEKTNPWWHVDGRWFKEGADECLVGAAFARKFGVKTGDVLNVHANDLSGWKTLKVVGLVSTGGPEENAVVAPLSVAQALAETPGKYRRLYVSALTKPEDAFARKDPKTMTPAEYDTWYCTPYISSIALQISEELKGTDVRVIRRVAEGEGTILTRVRTLLWLVTFAALLAAALAVGASAAASVIERRTEIGLMKALGAGSGLVGVLLAAEQLLVAFVGGGIGYSVGILLARLLGQKIFGFTPEPKLFLLFIILVLASLITLLGSAYPLRRASQYDPAPILRGE